MIKFNNTTITYNLNGQISSKVVPGVGTTTYSYDSFGNLLEVQTPTNHVKYEVDGRNRRTEVKQFSSVFKTRYVWDGQLRVIAELASNNALVKKYVYAEGVNSPEYMIFEGKKYLFVKDHRGSVNLVVNAETGEVKQKIRYSEWGEVLEDTNPGFQPFGFAGGLYDGVTRLYRFGARDYDPELGRWLSKDPIGFNGGDTNLYGYVLQDPVNLIDYNGEETTITYYSNNYGHISVKAGDGPSQGFYPGDEDMSDGQTKNDSSRTDGTITKTINTTPEQEKIIREAMERYGKEGKYQPFNNNCAQRVSDALKEAGINVPRSTVPRVFINNIK